jgi:hypothetical protein
VVRVHAKRRIRKTKGNYKNGERSSWEEEKEKKMICNNL